MKFSTSFVTTVSALFFGMSSSVSAGGARKQVAASVKGLKSPEAISRMLALDYKNKRPRIGGTVPGDGECDIEDLDEEHLKYARIFQAWFVENYLDGKYIKLKGGDEKEYAAYDFFNEYADEFYGFITMDGIDAMGEDIGLDMEFLKFYVNCLFEDYVIDEDELLKAICVGEPHFTTWQGANFDYHGACDLVLINNPTFDGYKGLDLHVRTEQIEGGAYSFVSDAALKIGKDIIEVRKTGEVFVNKEAAKPEQFPLGIGGYPASYDSSDRCFDIGPIHKCVPSQTVKVYVGEHETIVFKVFKDMVHVEVQGRPEEMAMGASGLMGTFPGERHGRIARDGFTLIQDQNEFGKEWQVREDEPKLFVSNRFPQFPETCVAPTENHAEHQRTLRSGLQSEKELKNLAKDACAHVMNEESTFKNCIFDVMATGDESHAMIYGVW